MGSNYNSKPLAAEVLIRDGQAHLIRARQTFEDLIRGETIPNLAAAISRLRLSDHPTNSLLPRLLDREVVLPVLPGEINGGLIGREQALAIG